jgi:hypothetical protein
MELLLLVITLIAVCLGLFMALPGLGIIAAIVAAPALIHVLVAREREQAVGTPTALGDKLLTFATSTAAALAALTLGGAAFGVAILLSCIVEARVLAPRMPAGSQNLVAFSLIGFSALVGLATAGWLYWILLPRRAK